MKGQSTGAYQQIQILIVTHFEIPLSGHVTCFGAQFNRPNKLAPTTPTAVALHVAPCAASILAELHTALPTGQTAQTSCTPRRSTFVGA